MVGSCRLALSERVVDRHHILLAEDVAVDQVVEFGVVELTPVVGFERH